MLHFSWVNGCEAVVGTDGVVTAYGYPPAMLAAPSGIGAGAGVAVKLLPTTAE